MWYLRAIPPPRAVPSIWAAAAPRISRLQMPYLRKIRPIPATVGPSIRGSAVVRISPLRTVASRATAPAMGAPYSITASWPLLATWSFPGIGQPMAVPFITILPRLRMVPSYSTAERASSAIRPAGLAGPFTTPVPLPSIPARGRRSCSAGIRTPRARTRSSWATVPVWTSRETARSSLMMHCRLKAQRRP